MRPRGAAAVASRRRSAFRRATPPRLKPSTARTWPGLGVSNSPLAISDTERTHQAEGGRRGGPEIRQGTGLAARAAGHQARCTCPRLASFQRRTGLTVIPVACDYILERNQLGTVTPGSLLIVPCFPMQRASSSRHWCQRKGSAPCLAYRWRRRLSLNPTDRRARANYFLGRWYQAHPSGGGVGPGSAISSGPATRSRGRSLSRQRMR